MPERRVPVRKVPVRKVPVRKVPVRKVPGDDESPRPGWVGGSVSCVAPKGFEPSLPP
ncbi:MAG: hypothetical protein JWP68_2244 [Modestobacter sp.]|nr:hypothetical protein [Modestobacter sp.]